MSTCQDDVTRPMPLLPPSVDDVATLVDLERCGRVSSSLDDRFVDGMDAADQESCRVVMVSCVPWLSSQVAHGHITMPVYMRVGLSRRAGGHRWQTGLQASWRAGMGDEEPMPTWSEAVPVQRWMRVLRAHVLGVAGLKRDQVIRGFDQVDARMIIAIQAGLQAGCIGDAARLVALVANVSSEQAMQAVGDLF